MKKSLGEKSMENPQGKQTDCSTQKEFRIETVITADDQQLHEGTR